MSIFERIFKDKRILIVIIVALALVLTIILSIIFNNNKNKTISCSNKPCTSHSSAYSPSSVAPSATAIASIKTSDNKEISNVATKYIKVLHERDYRKGYPGFNVNDFNGIVTGLVKDKTDKMASDISNHSGDWDKNWTVINNSKTISTIIVDKTTVYDHSNDGYYNVTVQWHLETNSASGKIISPSSGDTIIVKLDSKTNKYVCYNDSQQQTP